MNNPWILLAAGILFCLAGLYFFYKSAFEEDKSILPSILILLAGITMIGVATAKLYHLID